MIEVAFAPPVEALANNGTRAGEPNSVAWSKITDARSLTCEQPTKEAAKA
jgi:hypothetical protein